MSVDGLLIDYTDHIPPRLREALAASGLPAVWLNVKREADCVYPDDFGAGKTIGEHLIDAGHRRIAYVDVTHDRGDPDLHYSVRDRLAGVRNAANKAEFEVETLFFKSFSVSQLLAALGALWEREAPITAIVGYGEQDFELIWRAALESGRRVPNDVSVAIFCDIREVPLLGFDVTRREVPREVEGQRAVQLLLQKIGAAHHKTPPQPVPFELLAGETVAAPKVGATH